MKRLLLVLACTCAIVLSTAAPSAAFPGQRPQGYGANEHKHSWFSFHWGHKEKHPKEKHEKLHKFPKSVGWWRHNPGPAGAGAK